MLIQKKTAGFSSTMYRGLVMSSNALKICELFAGFFAQNFVKDGNDTLNTSNVRERISIGSISLTPDDVYEHLLAIDTNKGDGLDNSSPLFLRICVPTLAIHILPISYSNVPFNRNVPKKVENLQRSTDL